MPQHPPSAAELLRTQLRSVGTSVRPELHDRLVKIAEEKGCTVSQVLRDALEQTYGSDRSSS